MQAGSPEQHVRSYRSEKGSLVSGCRQLIATSQATVQTCSSERAAFRMCGSCQRLPGQIFETGLQKEAAK